MLESPIAAINNELTRLQLFPDCEVREIVGATDCAMWGDCYNNLFPIHKLGDVLQILQSQHPSIKDTCVVAIVKSFSRIDIHVYYKDGDFFSQEQGEKVS